MVQALAFAEIFLGLILADAGYKGVPIPQVVKGEAGKNTPPAPLGAPPSTTGTGSTPGETVPQGTGLAPSPQEAAKNAAFGPSPGNTPPIPGLKTRLERELEQKEQVGAIANSPQGYQRAERELTRLRSGR